MLLMCAPNHITSYLPNASRDLWQRYLPIIFDGCARKVHTHCPNVRICR
jgi:hypothetical protein